MNESPSGFAGGAGAPRGMGLLDALWAMPRCLGLGMDALMSRMVHALAGGASGFGAAFSSGAAGDSGTMGRAGAAGAPGSAGGGSGSAGGGLGGGADWPMTAPWALRQTPAAGAGKDAGGEDGEQGPEGGLAAPGTKLVGYCIVSVRRCAEGILPGGSGEVLVAERMTGVDFAVWTVATYLQSEAYRAAVRRDPTLELRHEDKKDLRVFYRVITRWATQPRSGCGDRKADALARIRDAISARGGALGALAAPATSTARATAKPTVRSTATLTTQATATPAAHVTATPTVGAAISPAEDAAPLASSSHAAALPDTLGAERDAAGAAVLRALHQAGGSAATAELVRRTRLPRTRVRRALHDLEVEGRIRRSGEGLQTRYHQAVSE